MWQKEHYFRCFYWLFVAASTWTLLPHICHENTCFTSTNCLGKHVFVLFVSVWICLFALCRFLSRSTVINIWNPSWCFHTAMTERYRRPGACGNHDFVSVQRRVTFRRFGAEELRWFGNAERKHEAAECEQHQYLTAVILCHFPSLMDFRDRISASPLPSW